MAKHVISTLNADNKYTAWDTQPGVNTVERSVLVRGGAGVALRGSGRIYTPTGVRTEVSDEDAEFLANHDHFKEHQKRGFVKLVSAVVAPDPDSVGQKMDKDTGSKPVTPEDVKKAAEDASKKSGLTPNETLSVATNKK